MSADVALVHVERRSDGVAVVRLDNPKVNALSSTLLAQLEAAAVALTEDPPGAVVVTGGDRIFAAGGISFGAAPLDDVLGEGSEALAALTSAGGILIIGISLKLLDLRDVKVGNYLPALLFAPCIVGVVSLFD